MRKINHVAEALASDEPAVSEALDTLVHEAASRLASDANNRGASGQIEFLRSRVGWSHKEILGALNELLEAEE